jgi:hypothetical protein
MLKVECDVYHKCCIIPLCLVHEKYVGLLWDCCVVDDDLCDDDSYVNYDC